MRPRRRLTLIPFLLVAFSLMLTLCAWLAGGPSELLGTLPAIVLAVFLALNRYPGEELIARLGRRYRRPKARPSSLGAPRWSAGAAISYALLLLADVRQLRGPPRLSSISI